MNGFELYLIAGFAGGVVRGLSGFLKNLKKEKRPRFDWAYFGSTVFVSGLIGGAAGAFMEGNWKTAFLAGYAGIDFLENSYKSSPLAGLAKRS